MLGKAPIAEWDLPYSNHHAFSVIRPCRQLRTSWCLQARKQSVNEIGKEPVIFCCLLPPQGGEHGQPVQLTVMSPYGCTVRIAFSAPSVKDESDPRRP